MKVSGQLLIYWLLNNIPQNPHWIWNNVINFHSLAGFTLNYQVTTANDMMAKANYQGDT